jgi:hypothetical protein
VSIHPPAGKLEKERELWNGYHSRVTLPRAFGPGLNCRAQPYESIVFVRLPKVAVLRREGLVAAALGHAPPQYPQNLRRRGRIRIIHGVKFGE